MEYRQLVAVCLRRDCARTRNGYGVIDRCSRHVHHARNPQYIDRNYAGVLVIWDRLFGTFVEEDPSVPCDFGIIGQIHSYNPLTLTFHE